MWFRDLQEGETFIMKDGDDKDRKVYIKTGMGLAQYAGLPYERIACELNLPVIRLRMESASPY